MERWAAYVAWSSEGDPLPALAQALDWCRRHVPPEREPVLLWGDVRLGNLVFDAERRVTAVLDWDLASIGPREMDLGWHIGLEFMMEALFGGRPPGFPGTAETLERYGRRSGYEAKDLAWHEVFALARALAINDRHQRITGDERAARTRWVTSSWAVWRRRPKRSGDATRRCGPGGPGAAARPVGRRRRGRWLRAPDRGARSP